MTQEKVAMLVSIGFICTLIAVPQTWFIVLFLLFAIGFIALVRLFA